MNSEDLPIPGGRDVRATLDEPDSGSARSIVVACSPHPQHRGHRGDARLKAVSEYLVARGIACLRFDYGEWDEGYGEREDARNALRWARERYDRVGIFGFSFGTAVAALAAASVDPQPEAVSLLAPTPRLADDLDTVAALDDVESPIQVVYGTRDDTVDWEPVVERARELDHEVVEISGDHFFVGQHEKVADAVGGFLAERLG
ncbi:MULTISPECIES: alpha/beta hydrolase [Halorussus]|uniref:alpha/beta hydrolase n=1 Tax=Halorussus TaxID=1070314 RepID=UPI00209E5A49|nr:dienelactone hydrolase family protein [Halorussus vallis]USZ77261.1 dienelactone hydrolase family protein [Halorussus vallis]